MLSAWRREALRTNLWLVPTVEIGLAVGLFAGTYALDRAVYDNAWNLPSFVISGSADAARQVLTAIAAAVITVVTLVFSITIVTLTLASTQFGPRMLRNFIRDRITQLTLGSFVATFVFAVLALVSIGPGPHGEFVPHVSITVTMALLVLDVALLVVFIDHIARSIQLPRVIASIAGDLSGAIDAEASPRGAAAKAGPSQSEMLARLEEDSATVRAPGSGYLQYVSITKLIDIAAAGHAVIRLLHRPGHFVTEGEPLADVWPASAAPRVARALGGAHATGPHRTLTQDLSFAVDQLVEIAIRALSPGGQRHVHGARLHRLARRRPRQDGKPLEPGRRASRRRRSRARDHGNRQLPASARALARQDSPGQPRHAGRHDPPARRAQQGDGAHPSPASSASSCWRRPT